MEHFLNTLDLFHIFGKEPIENAWKNVLFLFILFYTSRLSIGESGDISRMSPFPARLLFDTKSCQSQSVVKQIAVAIAASMLRAHSHLLFFFFTFLKGW